MISLDQVFWTNFLNEKVFDNLQGFYHYTNNHGPLAIKKKSNFHWLKSPCPRVDIFR